MQIPMKNDTFKRIRERNDIKVHVENPKKGVNFERLSMALNLLLSEKDVIGYLNECGMFSSPTLNNPQVLAKQT